MFSNFPRISVLQSKPIAISYKKHDKHQQNAFMNVWPNAGLDQYRNCHLAIYAADRPSIKIADIVDHVH